MTSKLLYLLGLGTVLALAGDELTLVAIEIDGVAYTFQV